MKSCWNFGYDPFSRLRKTGEGWFHGRVQKREDNEGRKKGAREEKRRLQGRVYRERTSAGRVLAWRLSEPLARLPSSPRKNPPRVSLSFITIPCVMVEKCTLPERIRTSNNNTENWPTIRSCACLSPCVHALAHDRVSSLFVVFVPFSRRTARVVLAMCVFKRESCGSSHASPQRSMSTRCHASA